MQKKVGILDYNCGNIRSISNAIEFLGYNYSIVSNESDLLDVSHLVLPGVGAFAHCKREFKKTNLLEPLRKWVDDDNPLLGICVGMQLLSEVSYEFGEHKGFGLIPGEVRHLSVPESKLRLPHVGWDDIKIINNFGNFNGTKEYAFYFTHSYGYHCNNKSNVFAKCTYGEDFDVVIKKNNLLGCQFHPEKSQENGIEFLKFFLSF